MNEQDHLEKLPAELLQHVCSYLLPTHDPDRSLLEDSLREPLNNLAVVNKNLYGVVEGYSKAVLMRWSSLTNCDGTLPKSKKSPQTFRGKLLRWKDKHCVFCGKKSQRKAIMFTGLGCCSECDRKVWPEKITRTDAKKEFDLNDDHLFPEAGDPYPAIRFGKLSIGIVATMFLRSDVERLATAVHGDYKAHLAARKARRERRKQKIAENKQKHRESGACPGKSVCLYCC